MSAAPELLSRASIQHNRQGRDARRLHIAVHQEPLAVFADVVTEDVGGRDRRSSVKLEERRRRAGGKSAECADRYRGQRPCAAKVENFFAVSAPAGFGPAAARDLPLSHCTWECGPVNFPVPRLVGSIPDPFSISRNLTIILISCACQE